MSAADRLQLLVAEGEGQTLEFKSSLSSGAQNEGIQSLVAFANTEGGRVLFGVRDDGTIAGAEVGVSTLEDLANRIAARTYPSLQPAVDVEHHNDGDVVIVEVPADRPPLVGAYLVSSRPIDPGSQLDATSMQCFRRVGRTNQAIDFMRLRSPSPTDALVVMRLEGGGGTAGEHFPRTRYFSFSNGGNGWAHNVHFDIDHDDYSGTVSVQDQSLPPPPEEPRKYKDKAREAKLFVSNAEHSFPSADRPMLLSATYEDTAGLTWRSTLQLYRQSHGDSRLYDFKQGSFSYRIVGLPAKAQL